jgi:NADPH-dependent 7-cyano-7-deazaguanine reductase QueF
MTTLATMPNEEPETRTVMRHTLPLPSCCPVSGNPQPGSEIRISYEPAGSVLEVYHLDSYLRSYVGGHPDGTRNMEAMVQHVARDCAAILGVRVRVYARVLLQHGSLELLAIGRP